MEEHDKAPNASGIDSPWGGKHSYQNVNPEYHQTKLRELHAFLRKNPAGMTVEEVARELRLGSGEAHAMIDAELASRRVGVWGEEQGRPVYVTKQNRSFDPKKMPAGAPRLQPRNL